jgi:hypothetical protein
MHQAWTSCSFDKEFMLNWYIMMSLWQCILAISTSTPICELGFSKKIGLKMKDIGCIDKDLFKHFGH